MTNKLVAATCLSFPSHHMAIACGWRFGCMAWLVGWGFPDRGGGTARDGSQVAEDKHRDCLSICRLMDRTCSMIHCGRRYTNDETSDEKPLGDVVEAFDSPSAPVAHEATRNERADKWVGFWSDWSPRAGMIGWVDVKSGNNNDSHGACFGWRTRKGWDINWHDSPFSNAPLPHLFLGFGLTTIHCILLISIVISWVVGRKWVEKFIDYHWFASLSGPPLLLSVIVPVGWLHVLYAHVLCTLFCSFTCMFFWGVFFSFWFRRLALDNIGLLTRADRRMGNECIEENQGNGYIYYIYCYSTIFRCGHVDDGDDGERESV